MYYYSNIKIFENTIFEIDSDSLIQIEAYILCYSSVSVNSGISTV